jgi:hypothetical protein
MILGSNMVTLEYQLNFQLVDIKIVVFIQVNLEAIRKSLMKIWYVKTK